MKKKGFTLIELLAVIVILAIIALIATPIILNIISDSKEESNKRSVELYGKAVEQAIAKSQLNGNEIPAGDLSSTFLETVQYSGSEVTCTTNKLYEDGGIYLAGCIVNGTEVDYTYGEQQITQVYKPQYYYFGFDWGGNIGETAAPAESERLTVPPTGEIRYLGYDVTDGVVTAAYDCFTRNEIEYCLKGYDAEAFTTNTDIIKDAYADVVDTDACSFGDIDSSCSAGGLRVYADSFDSVSALAGSVGCGVSGDGSFGCGEF